LCVYCTRWLIWMYYPITFAFTLICPYWLFVAPYIHMYMYVYI